MSDAPTPPAATDGPPAAPSDEAVKAFRECFHDHLDEFQTRDIRAALSAAYAVDAPASPTPAVSGDAATDVLVAELRNACCRGRCSKMDALLLRTADHIASLQKDVEKWRTAENEVSAAYVRLRGILGALNTPHRGPTPQQVWEYTEKCAERLQKRCNELQMRNDFLVARCEQLEAPPRTVISNESQPWPPSGPYADG